MKDVEKFITDYGHLKNIPTKKEVIEEGVELGEMVRLLLQKVEELTLYTIEQQKQIDRLTKEKINLIKDFARNYNFSTKNKIFTF